MEKFLSELQERFMNIEFNERIKYLRRLRNLTIKQAAEISITTEKCWSDWENGNTIPRDKNRKIIARALKVREDIIFGKPNIYVFNHLKEMQSQEYTGIMTT